MNLYTELVDKLTDYDKTIDDIVWVGGEDFSIPLDYFLELAKETDYNDESFGQEIAEDLLIVGNDWWLEREEHNGLEWFEFKTYPKKPDLEYKVRNLSFRQAQTDTRIKQWSSGYYSTLMGLNIKEIGDLEVLENGK